MKAVLLGIFLLSSVALSQITYQDYVIIDDFVVGSTVVLSYDSYDPPPGGLPYSVSVIKNTILPNHILGNQRDDQITLFTGASGESVFVNSVNNGYFTVSTPNFATGQTLLQYDGPDGSMGLALNGLGSVDMTFGGLASQFHTIAGTDISTVVRVKFYSGANIVGSSAADYCLVQITIPDGSSVVPVETIVDFTAIPEVGLGCEWTAISAIEVTIDMAGGCDPFIDILSSYGPVPSPTASVSISRSVTPTISETPSRTPSETASPSISSSPSPSSSPTPSASPSASPTQTISETPSPSASQTASPSISSSSSPSPSATVTPTPSVSETPSPSVTPSPSDTPTNSPTPSVSPSLTSSFSSTPTITGTISETPTRSITGTTSRSQTTTPSPSVTPTPSRTSSASPTQSPSLSASSSQSSSLSASSSLTASPSVTPTSTRTISVTPSITTSTTASISKSVDTSPTSSKTPTYTSSISPSTSPTRTASVSVTPTRTRAATPSRTSGVPISQFVTYCNAAAPQTNGRTGFYSIDQAFSNAWLQVNPAGGCNHLATYDTEEEFQLLSQSILDAGGQASIIGGRRSSSSSYQWGAGEIRGKNWIEPWDQTKAGTAQPAHCLQSFCLRDMTNAEPIKSVNEVGMAVVVTDRLNPKLVPSAGANCYTVEIATSSLIGSVDGGQPLQFFQSTANFDSHQTAAINNRQFIARVSTAQQNQWIKDELQCGTFQVWLGYETSTVTSALRLSAGPSEGLTIQPVGSTTCNGAYCNFPSAAMITTLDAAVQMNSATGFWSVVAQSGSASAVRQRQVCPVVNGLVSVCTPNEFGGWYNQMTSANAYSSVMLGNSFYAGSGYQRPAYNGQTFSLYYFDCNCATDYRVDLSCLGAEDPSLCTVYTNI